jgi:putative membrane protein insertion efficiency factor
MQKVPSTISRAVISAIRFYQRYFSPDHSLWATAAGHRYCRFHPTCSEYAVEAIEKRGLMIGIAKAFWRVLRCNPWSKGGEDPVERKK